MSKRIVSDILYLGEAPVAFNQISFKSNKYECVCPWCANNLGKVRATTYGDLAFKLYDIQVKHMPTCPNREETQMIVKIKG